MSPCPWCGEPMTPDSDGLLTCIYECADTCLDCGGVVGECHENGECAA